jgi:hypothetical protein
MSSSLQHDLADLLARFRAELEYSDAKGAGPYREGMHDGLHFAADALADLLSKHGIEPVGMNGSGGIPREYGVRS